MAGVHDYWLIIDWLITHISRKLLLHNNLDVLKFPFPVLKVLGLNPSGITKRR